MELIIQPIEKAKPIVFNYEELKTAIATRVQDYKTLQYTAEQIDLAKKDRANLNALKKSLSDERIRRKKEYLEPFEQFESQVKELCELIDEPVQLIDRQVKEYEESEKANKREACMQIFFGTAELPEWLKYEQIENPKWYNKTTSVKTITEEIEAKINHINVDIQMLSALPNFSFEAVEVYKETLDSGKALIEGNRLADIQKRKEEAAKAEKERQEMLTRAAEEREAIPFESDEMVEIKSEKEQPVTRAWIKFEAYLSASEATDLKAFFNYNKIQFKPAKED